MKTSKLTVLLFEDSSDELPAILGALKEQFPKNSDIIAFGGSQKANDTGTYEVRILRDFRDELSKASLILCDQDLSGIPGYSGLSANVVISIAHSEGIPIAIYGRGNSDNMIERLRQRRPFLERRFVLELGEDWSPVSFAKSASIVLEGCTYIHNSINKLLKTGGTKMAKATPAIWLSKILERESIQTRISLYGAGDQQFMEALSTVDISLNANRGIKQLAAEISYWLWDSILRYPGILLNDIAAASFAGIDEKSWTKAPILELFRSAKYEGPFSDMRQYWWRDEIVRILDGDTGVSLVKKNKIKNVKPATCYEDNKTEAGYYCMLSEKPVSLKNSHGNIPYFPSGADLARISSSQFAKIAPWTGLISDSRETK